jgi:hypothetical protein
LKIKQIIAVQSNFVSALLILFGRQNAENASKMTGHVAICDSVLGRRMGRNQQHVTLHLCYADILQHCFSCLR